MIPHQPGQAGAVGEHKGRGVWVPDGLDASWIMEGAAVLESRHEIAPFISRSMMRDVLQAVLPLIASSDISGWSQASPPSEQQED
jgi:hypothetical protein